MILEQNGGTPISEKESVYGLLKRPELKLENFKSVIDHPIFNNELDADILESVREQVEIEIKYEGYFKRQQEQVIKFKKMEDKLIPNHFDFDKIGSLSKESREKLKRIKPRTGITYCWCFPSRYFCVVGFVKKAQVLKLFHVEHFEKWSDGSLYAIA